MVSFCTVTLYVTFISIIIIIVLFENLYFQLFNNLKKEKKDMQLNKMATAEQNGDCLPFEQALLPLVHRCPQVSTGELNQNVFHKQ